MKRTLTTVAVAVLLVGCSSGSTKAKDNGAVTTSGAAGAQTAALDVRDSLTFSPSTVNAKVGTVTLSVTNKGGTPHNLTFNDSAVLSKESEEGLLYRDMQSDMVQQIMRRLAAAQRPKPAAQ